jgi:Abnormal spindle-like microcephaly-assoc'd, ASPM-SPD-2-Hydin
VGETSAARDVFVINYGDTALTISSIVAGGNFAQKNNCTATIAPGKYCAIAVTFTPKATGTLTGAITVTDNGISSSLKVTLTGTGQ